MKVDTIQQKGRTAQILLVEDNYGDVILTQVAFKKSKIANNITVARNGEEALQILRKESPFSNTVKPDLILLDLNLPGKSGCEVLREIKSDTTLCGTPVIIFTSSQAELDVVSTYNSHANSYLIKPTNLDKFDEIVETIERYWFSLVVLPTTLQ